MFNLNGIVKKAKALLGIQWRSSSVALPFSLIYPFFVTFVVLNSCSLRCKLFSFLCVPIGATLLESFAYNGFCAHSLNISLSYFFNFFFCARHSVECNNSRVWIKEWSLRINYRTLSCFTISSTKCIWMIIVLTCFLIPVSIGAKWKKNWIRYNKNLVNFSE